MNLKKKYAKLRSKRFVSNDYITCKFCGLDFAETQNFNWSCRTHRSEFSGEVWWCCGKTNKDALGCKFGKHIGRDDIEEEDALDKGRALIMNN